MTYKISNSKLTRSMFALLMAVTLIISMLPISNFNTEIVSGETNLTYLALGDNITSGEGLEDANDGFVYVLADMLGTTTVIDFGDSTGNKSEGILNMIGAHDYDTEIKAADVITITTGTYELRYAYYEQIAIIFNETYNDTIDADDVEILIHNPGYSVAVLEKAQLLLAMLNTNDYRQRILNTADFVSAVESIAININSIYSYINEANPNAVILVANTYNPYQWTSECQNIADLFTVGEEYLNTLISQNSYRYGYYVVDLKAAFEASTTTLTNADVDFSSLKFEFDYLPNADGHKAIAEAMYTAYEAAKYDYSWEIPVTVTIANGGSAEAVAQEFEFEILNYNLNPIDIEGTEYNGKIVFDSVTTNGSGTYSAKIKFSGGSDLDTQLSDGFYMQLKTGTASGWTYDNALYYIIEDDGELCFYICDEDGTWDYWGDSDLVELVAFTCTYTGYTLSFDTGEGASVASVEAAAETAISLSDYTSTRTGYTFNGWYLSDLTTAVTSVTLSADTTVYAGWTDSLSDVATISGVLTLGDRVAYGYELDDPDNDSFSALFGKTIGATDIVNNGSASINSSSELLTSINSGTSDSAIESADVITIAVGEDEMMQAFYDGAADVFNNHKASSLPTITGDEISGVISYLSESTVQQSASLLTTLTALTDSTSNLGKGYDLFQLLNATDYSTEIAASDSLKAAAEAYVSNINSIAAKIKEINPDAVILVTNTYCPYLWLSGCENVVNLCAASSDLFNTTLKANQSSDYTIADVASVFASSADSQTFAYVDATTLSLNFDNYPNESGHSSITYALTLSYSEAIGASDSIFTLSFDTNGGTAVTSVAATEGTVIKLSDYTTTRDGYAFTGWYSDSALTTAVTEITITADTTVYAGWEQVASTEESGETTETPTTEETNTQESTEEGTTEESEGSEENEDTEETEDTEDTEETEETEDTEDTEDVTEETTETGTEDTKGSGSTDSGGSTGTGGSSSSPKTGESSGLILWILLALACWGGLISATTIRRTR